MTNVFCLMGPTASGKTALAIDLVETLPFEIISVDSAMIYRGMDIGTAKPSQEELIRAPHHLIDIKNPPEVFSAADFCEATFKLCAEITQRGKIPLLVGGTMMYFNALQQGLSTLPAANETLRAGLINEAEQIGWVGLHQRLMQVDPISANKIHCNDTQRIQRALEVYLITGKPMSDLLAQEKSYPAFNYINCLLLPQDRRWLHQRIETRFKGMLAQGFLQEVDNLLHQWPLTTSSPALRCVGYRQAYEHLCGMYDHAMLLEKGVAATRQLAKRQLTWLRHWQNAIHFYCDEADVKSKIIAIIREILDNDRN